MEGLQLVPGTVRDLPWVHDAQATLYPQEFRYSDVFVEYLGAGFPPFRQAMRQGTAWLWLVTNGDRKLGAIALIAAGAGTGTLRWMFLQKEARGHGMGRKLMQAALQQAKDARLTRLNLWTCSDLNAARHLYEEAGFVLHQETACPWKDSVVQQEWLRINFHANE